MAGSDVTHPKPAIFKAQIMCFTALSKHVIHPKKKTKISLYYFEFRKQKKAKFSYLIVELKLVTVIFSPGRAKKKTLVSAQSFSTYSLALIAKKRNLNLFELLM